MKLVTYTRRPGGDTWGVYRDGWVIDVRSWAAASVGDPVLPLPSTLIELLEDGPASLDRVRDIAEEASRSLRESGKPRFMHKEEDVVWRPPLPRARLISMRGNNPILLRLDGLPIPEHPTLTPRHPGRLIGHQEPITLRREDGEIAWGAEFVAVVGRVTRDVDVLQAKDAVAGYMATNDLSGSCFAQVIAPDLSRDNYNYRDEHFAGKFYGTWSMPQSVGPWLVTADEIDDPYHLTVAAYENGVPCDIVTTAAMLFTFEDLISFLSRFMTLRPGDLISSGALGYHVINGLGSYPSGSEFAIEIEHVGTLRNPIDDRRGVAVP